MIEVPDSETGMAELDLFMEYATTIKFKNIENSKRKYGCCDIHLSLYGNDQDYPINRSDL